MSGRDNITGPEAVQLPASVSSRLSHKSFTNFVPVLTDENFFHDLLFLVSYSFRLMPLSTTQFIQSSATLFAKSFESGKHLKCSGALHGKTVSPNNELMTATSLFLAVQLSFFLPEKGIRLLILPFIAPFHPCLRMSDFIQFLGGSNRGNPPYRQLIHPLPSHFIKLLSLFCSRV